MEKKNGLFWYISEMTEYIQKKDQVLDWIRKECVKAAKAKKKLICFPELTLAEHPFGPQMFYTTSVKHNAMIQKLRELCRCYGLYMIIGIAEPSIVPGKIYDTVLTVNPVGEVLDRYVVYVLDGERQLFFSRAAKKEEHILKLPFADIGLLAGGDAFDEEMLQAYHEADMIVLCLSDQNMGKIRACEIKEKLHKPVILTAGK